MERKYKSDIYENTDAVNDLRLVRSEGQGLVCKEDVGAFRLLATFDPIFVFTRMEQEPVYEAFGYLLYYKMFLQESDYAVFYNMEPRALPRGERFLIPPEGSNYPDDVQRESIDILIAKIKSNCLLRGDKAYLYKTTSFATSKLTSKPNSMVRLREDGTACVISLTSMVAGTTLGFEAGEWRMGGCPAVLDIPSTCVVCGSRPEKLSRCSLCKFAKYCGINCQKKDWSDHKCVCTLLK